MFDRRRLLVLVAVIFGLSALSATLRTPRDTAPPPAVARPSDGLDVGAPPEPGVRVRRVSVDEAPQTVRARVGQVLRLEVSGDVVDSVLIADLDRLEAIDPQSPARFELLPEAPGTHEIRLLDAPRLIGTLDIRASGG